MAIEFYSYDTPVADEPVAGQPDAEEAGAEEPSEVADSAEESDDEGGQKAESDSEPGQESKEAPKAKADGGFQRRIDKLVREREEQAAELRELRAKLDGFVAGKGGTAEKQSEKPAGPPQQEDFETFEAWDAARIEYAVEQKLNAKLTADREAFKRQYAERQADEAAKAWHEKLTPVLEADSDFKRLLDEDPDMVVPGGSIATLDRGPEVLAQFVRLPEAERNRINALAPARQLVELAKIEAKLPEPGKSSKPAAKPSSAPPPIKPIGAASGTVREFDPHTAKPDDPGWKGWMEQRAKARRERGGW